MPPILARQRETCGGYGFNWSAGVVGVEAASASAGLAPGNLGVVQKHLSQSYEKSDLIRS